ncbi:unnamed protein product, partial [Rotaria sordida]
MCLMFNGKSLEDDSKTLSDYNIPPNADLQLIKRDLGEIRADLGSAFADVSNSKAYKELAWNENAPIWRITVPGLCLEGECENRKCVAYNESVIIPIGYRDTFDMLVDANATTSICPMCQTFVEPKTCSFNNCWWQWRGIKQSARGSAPAPCE